MYVVSVCAYVPPECMCFLCFLDAPFVAPAVAHSSFVWLTLLLPTFRHAAHCQTMSLPSLNS